MYWNPQGFRVKCGTPLYIQYRSNRKNVLHPQNRSAAAQDSRKRVLVCTNLAERCMSVAEKIHYNCQHYTSTDMVGGCGPWEARVQVEILITAH